MQRRGKWWWWWHGRDMEEGIKSKSNGRQVPRYLPKQGIIRHMLILFFSHRTMQPCLSHTFFYIFVSFLVIASLFSSFFFPRFSRTFSLANHKNPFFNVGQSETTRLFFIYFCTKFVVQVIVFDMNPTIFFFLSDQHSFVSI